MVFQTLNDVPWHDWHPDNDTTLLFVIKNEYVLLIEKLRGLGKCKINAPGGKLDMGETPKVAAEREFQEEVQATARGAREAGTLEFQFVDGLAQRCFVFRADDCDGEPQATDEAIPMWMPIDKIPYERMWADDQYWLPMLLRGESFFGQFLFDDDRLIEHRLSTR